MAYIGLARNSRRDFLREGGVAATDADLANFEGYLAKPETHNAYLAAGPRS